MQKSRSIILWVILPVSGIFSAYGGQQVPLNEKCEQLPEVNDANCAPNGAYSECYDAIYFIYKEGLKDENAATSTYKERVDPYMDDSREYHSEGDASGARESAMLAQDSAQKSAASSAACTAKMSAAQEMSHELRGRLQATKYETYDSCNLQKVNARLKQIDKSKTTCTNYNGASLAQKSNAAKMITHSEAKISGKTAPPLELEEVKLGSGEAPAPETLAKVAATRPPVAPAPSGPKPSGAKDADPSLASGLEGAPKALPIDDPILGDNGAGYGRKSPASTPQAPTSSTSSSGAMMPALLGAVGGGVLGYVAGRANRTTETITNTKTTTVTGTNTNTASSSDAMAAIDCTKLGFATNADGTCNASVAATTTTATSAGNVVVAPGNQVVNGSGVSAVASTTSPMAPGVFVQNSALAGSRNTNLEIENPDCSNPANAERQSCQSERRALGTAQRAIFCSRNPSNPQCAGL